MGTHPPSRSCFGVVHLGELDRRTGWLLYKGSFHSFAGSRPRSSCDNWRDCGIAFGQQAFCCPGDFIFIGDSPSYRRNEIAFHEVAMPRKPRRPGVALATVLWAVSAVVC